MAAAIVGCLRLPTLLLQPRIAAMLLSWTPVLALALAPRALLVLALVLPARLLLLLLPAMTRLVLVLPARHLIILLPRAARRLLMRLPTLLRLFPALLLLLLLQRQAVLLLRPALWLRALRSPIATLLLFSLPRLHLLPPPRLLLLPRQPLLLLLLLLPGRRRGRRGRCIVLLQLPAVQAPDTRRLNYVVALGLRQVRAEEHLQLAQSGQRRAGAAPPGAAAGLTCGGLCCRAGGAMEERGRGAVGAGAAPRQEEARIDAVGPRQAQRGGHLPAQGHQALPPSQGRKPRRRGCAHCRQRASGTAAARRHAVHHLVDQQHSQAKLVGVAPAGGAGKGGSGRWRGHSEQSLTAGAEPGSERGFRRIDSSSIVAWLPSSLRHTSIPSAPTHRPRWVPVLVTRAPPEQRREPEKQLGAPSQLGSTHCVAHVAEHMRHAVHHQQAHRSRA